MTHTIKIDMDGPSGTFEIDGQEVSKAVASFTVAYSDPASLPRVEVGLVATSMLLAGVDADVVLDPDSHGLLLLLGWLPPLVPPVVEAASQ